MNRLQRGMARIYVRADSQVKVKLLVRELSSMRFAFN
jgi:hypothetical protein